jgi:hypothetical protein
MVAPSACSQLIAVSMIEVPMRVDQMPDWVAAAARKGLQNSRARRSDAGNENLTVRPSEHGDITGGAFEYASTVHP